MHPLSPPVEYSFPPMILFNIDHFRGRKLFTLQQRKAGPDTSPPAGLLNHVLYFDTIMFDLNPSLPKCIGQIRL